MYKQILKSNQNAMNGEMRPVGIISNDKTIINYETNAILSNLYIFIYMLQCVISNQHLIGHKFDYLSNN